MNIDKKKWKYEYRQVKKLNRTKRTIFSSLSIVLKVVLITQKKRLLLIAMSVTSQLLQQEHIEPL